MLFCFLFCHIILSHNIALQHIMSDCKWISHPYQKYVITDARNRQAHSNSALPTTPLTCQRKKKRKYKSRKRESISKDVIYMSPRIVFDLSETWYQDSVTTWKILFFIIFSFKKCFVLMKIHHIDLTYMDLSIN